MVEGAHRLLLVEDDATVRRATARVLRQAADACVVDEARSVAEGRALLNRHGYSAAVLDMWLPDGDGLELLAWARRTGWRGAALLVTGQVDPALPGRAMLLGAPVVFKPAPAAVLRAFAAAPAYGSSLDQVVQALAAEHGLSHRQRALLTSYAHGTPRARLAAALSVEENTVKTMVRQILHKTGDTSLECLLRQLLWRATEAPLS